MSKCKRNILLIFGYCLIMAILFLPIQKRECSFSGEIISRNNSVAFLPFFFKQLIKYEKYKNWNHSVSLKHKEQINEFVNDFIKKLEKELEILEKTRGLGKEPSLSEFFIKQELEALKEGRYNDVPKAREFFEKLKKSREAEFKSKLGNILYYYKLRVEFFITLISIIIFAGGLAYIVFCVVLSKSEKVRGR